MMRTSPIGEVIIELSEIDSTNNYAMRLINEGMAEHGMLIRADYQTHGKGQMGNVWQAEESKNLLCSVILDTKGLALEKQFYFNAACCLAIAEMLMNDYDMENVSVKWPNDIYAGKKKIAGILIENQIRGTQWTHSILGIGLNVNQSKFGDVMRATSVSNEIGKSVKIGIITKQVMKALQKTFLLIENNEEVLLSRYNSHLLGAGKSVSYIRNYELYHGTLLRVNPEGSIEIEVSGKIRKFKHKEIEIELDSFTS